MVSKRSGAPNSGTTKAEKRAAAGESAPAKNGWGSGKSKRKGSGLPTWLIVVGAFGLLACAGRLFAGDATPSKSQKGAPAKGGKSSGPLSTQRYLALALRLQEMTQVATSLEVGGALDTDAARELDKELTTIDEELGATEDPTARDLRSMVTVVRGTLYQRAEKLTDEEVENLTGSFTYANPRYWDDYYNKTSQGEMFDWYGSWDTGIVEMKFNPKGAEESVKASNIGDILKPYFSTKSDILMLGCGNSDMSEKMYKDGYEGIMNVDISESLLDKLRTRLGANMPNMKWQFANASKLAFETGSYDVIIDKGTFDAIEQNKGLLTAAAREARRVLRSGGYFLSVTFNDADLRIEEHLRKAAIWVDCYTHTFERQLRQGTKAEKSTYYVHACLRP